jgi:hypothetical protein
MGMFQIYHLITKLYFQLQCNCSFFFLSQDSSVGIATRYELEGPGIESL